MATPTQANLAAVLTAALVARKRPSNPHHDVYELAALGGRDAVLTLLPEQVVLFGVPGDTYQALDEQDEELLGEMVRQVANPLPLLRGHDWVTDTRYPKVFEHNPGVQWPTDHPGRPDLGHYLQEHKPHKCLAALLMGTSRHCQAETVRYYGLPADTVLFVKWANDWVAWQGPRNRPQFELFPWAELYLAWQQLGSHGPTSTGDMVYLYAEGESGRITNHRGVHLRHFSTAYLATLPAPTDADD